jgi:mono/diheme cytochrome c family protein
MSRVVFYTLLFSLLILAACSGDMSEQESSKAQEVPLRQAPANSVPITGKERRYDRGQAKGLVNPVPVNPASVKSGRKLFQTNCSMCHGKSGQGDGPVGVKFVPRPADLTSDRVQTRAEGELFLTITHGISTMPGFQKELSNQERWQLVNFIRNLKPAKESRPALPKS